MLYRIWLRTKTSAYLRRKREKMNHYYGSTANRSFDRLCKKIDAIDQELNRRSWKKYNRSEKTDKSYGVRREHGWYLPNDD